MRAVLFDVLGDSNVLRIGEIEKPEPGPGEVLVRVVYAGMNPADWKVREGFLLGYFDYHFPFVLGFDLAGEVVGIGAGIEGYRIGDQVFGTSMQGFARDGSYADYTIANPSMLAKVPDNVDLAALAGVPTAGLTAYGGLIDAGALKAGQTVLINGGAGGVGSYAIQIAKAIGARVATTCSADNADYVRNLGADLVINYRTEDVYAEIGAWAPDGVDLVLDAVGKNSLLPMGIELVKKGGHFIEIETLISQADEPLKAAAEMRGVHLRSNMVAVARLPEHLAGIAQMILSGQVKALIPEIVSMEGIAQALDRIKDGHVRGKIVAQISNL